MSGGLRKLINRIEARVVCIRCKSVDVDYDPVTDFYHCRRCDMKWMKKD